MLIALALGVDTFAQLDIAFGLLIFLEAIIAVGSTHKIHIHAYRFVIGVLCRALCGQAFGLFALTVDAGFFRRTGISAFTTVIQIPVQVDAFGVEVIIRFAVGISFVAQQRTVVVIDVFVDALTQIAMCVDALAAFAFHAAGAAVIGI